MNMQGYSIATLTQLELSDPNRLLRAMRKLCPVPGDEWLSVTVKGLSPGSGIMPHTHPTWVVLYYLEPGTPPPGVIVGGERLVPEPGQCITLSPNTSHMVERSNSSVERVVHAMQISPTI